MAVSPPSPRTYISPKRKRDISDSSRSSPTFSPDLSRGGTNLPEYPFSSPSEKSIIRKDSSPQSAVTSQLKDLELREPVVRQLAFFNDGGRARKRFAQMSTAEEFEDAAPSHSVDNVATTPCTDHNDHPIPLELGGDTSVQDACSLSTTTDPENLAQEQPEILSSIREKPRLRNGSPSLDGDPEDNPLTWHESEITGHNPADPNDDGYGINGIGFKPTAAIAWARSQRRKQQVAEYKSREAREARQRRSERRRAGGSEPREDNADCDVIKSPKKAIKVRFDDN